MALPKTRTLVYTAEYVLFALTTIPAIFGEIPQEEDGHVRILSLQRDIWKPASMDTYALHNMNVSEPFKDFSVCYWIRFATVDGLNPHFSYATGKFEANAILLFSESDELQAYVAEQPQDAKLRIHFYPEMWMHFCHVVDRSNYTIYLNGKVGTVVNRVGFDDIQSSGIIILGQEQDTFGGSFHEHQIFRGDIGALEMWNVPLSAEDVRQKASCVGQGLPRSVMSLSDDYFEVFGEVTESWVLEDYFCGPQINKPQFMVYAENLLYEENINICLQLNASLAVPTNDEENQILLEEVVSFGSACHFPQVRAWIGIKKIPNNTWVDMHSGLPIIYNSFQPPYPRNASFYFCATIITNGIWADVQCSFTRCGTCLMERTDFLMLRGLCFPSEIEARFFQSGYAGNKPMFRGYGGYIIFWSEEQWLLLDVQANETIASLKGDSVLVPVGVRLWTLNEEMCGSKGKVNISLSSCPEEDFVCRNGHCIPLEKRCNLVFDCADGGDEEDCRVVEVNRGYQSYFPPRGPGNKPLPLTPDINLMRVTHVDDINMAVSLEFSVAVTWQDSQLSYRHLHASTEKVMPTADANDIWKPRYKIINLKEAKCDELDEIVVISAAREPQVPDYNEIKRDIKYLGKDHNLTSRVHYAPTIICSFDLYVFPFDVQQCSIDLDLPQEYEDNVYFDVSRGTVGFTGEREVFRYTITNIRFDPTSPRDKLRIVFELQRRQGLVFLTTFIPSILLLLVSWATLFVKLEALNVRAVMALTTLLVLYTLFANLSRTVPQTDVVKLVDIWFFFIISLIFLNIMVHIFIDHMAALVPWVSRVSPRYLDEKNNAEKIIRVYRLFVFPLAVLLFNVGFWIRIFRY